METQNDSRYQLRSFVRLLNLIVDSENQRSLLSEEESLLCRRFLLLDIECQSFYVRYFSRKDAWFPASPESKEALDRCVLCGFAIDTDSSLDLESLTSLCSSLTGNQLAMLSAELSVLSQGRLQKSLLREKIIAKFFCQGDQNPKKVRLSQARLCISTGGGISLAAAAPSKAPNEFIQAILGRHFCIVQRQAFLKIFSFLPVAPTASASEASCPLLAAAILVELGKVAFPPYQLDSTFRFFADRQEFEQYFQFKGEYEHLQELAVLDFPPLIDKYLPLWLDSLPKASGKIFLRRFQPGHFLTKILHSIASAMEQKSLYQESAILYQSLVQSENAYCTHRRDDWWNRLIVISERYLKEKEKAVGFCKDAIADSFVSLFAKESLKRRLEKRKRARSDQIPQLVIFNGYSKAKVGHPALLRNEFGAKSRVEEFALQYYADSGWNGVHCESSLLSTVAVLYLWEEVFCSVPGFPLDFFTAEFYQSRREAIEAKLQSLTNELLEKTIIQQHSMHFGTSVVGVNWQLSMEALSSFCKLLASKQLVFLMRHLIGNFGRHCAGLPDLFLWNEATEQYLLVEVKSAGDRLSDRQIYWIALFKEVGVNFQLLKINSTA